MSAFRAVQGENSNPRSGITFFQVWAWVLLGKIVAVPTKWPWWCLCPTNSSLLALDHGDMLTTTSGKNMAKMNCWKHSWKKQDETHEPECRHVCWQTEAILICHISSKFTCETPWIHTLRQHSCRTPLLDTIAQRSGETLLLDSLVRHSCKTLLAWHSCKTLLLDTIVRHSSLTLLFDTLVRHSYLTLLWDRLTWHSYLTLL